MSYPPPLYSGDTGEASAWLRPASTPADLQSVTTQVHYLATGATTGGLFGLYRYEMTAARSGPDPVRRGSEASGSISNRCERPACARKNRTSGCGAAW